jgi:polysaccharide chain length determinant protein (PEP-CTERM system associated)
VENLQAMILVEVGRGLPGSFERNLYTIRYRDTDRGMAEDVVQVLLNSFQGQSLEGDLQDDLRALAFLDNQMAEYRRRLEEAETRVADFRRRNAGVIGAEGGFFTRLENLQEQLRQVRADLRIARERRAALGAQVSGAGSGEGDSSAAGLAELENQIIAAERRLDELRLKYTDEHPSVISARETVATLEGRLEQRREELGPLLSAGVSGAAVENVRIALTQAEIDITELSGRQRDLEQRISDLAQRVDVAPQLEAELAGLNRDHDVLRNQYESLLQRRELLSFDIDRKRQGRQLEFRIIEPPRALEAPVQPHRFLLMLMVLGGSLGTGATLAFVLHKARPTFVTGDMVYQELGIPVLGSVSMAWTGRATWIRRRAEVVFMVALVSLLGLFGVVFAWLPQLPPLVRQLIA